MSTYVAQVSLQANSGLAKDQFENVFHFVGPSPAASYQEAATAIGRLADFYTGHPSGESSGIDDFLSPVIDTTATVKVYDGSQKGTKTSPIGPVITASFMFQQQDTSDIPVPEEVALCLSYFSGRNSPRTRGRIYLGPFNESAVVHSTAPDYDGQGSRPSNGLMLAMASSATRLAANGDGATSMGTISGFVLGYLLGELPDTFAYAPVAGVNWAVRSSIGGGTKAAPVPDYALVTGGWIDNEWDSQHRRRLQASARTTWAG